MAIARASTSSDSSDTTSFNTTLNGSVMVGFVCYLNGATLTSGTFGGNAITVQSTQNLASDGWKISLFTYVGAFSGSNAVSYTFSGTPSFVRSYFIGYNGALGVEVPAGATNTGTTLSATSVSDNSWMVGGGISASSNSSFAGSTNQNGIVINGANNGIRTVVGDSNAALTPAGSKTQTYANPSAFSCSYVSIFVTPYIPQIAGAIVNTML